MEENRMPKKIFTQKLEGTRRRGRPRKGWREEVERDLQMLGVRRWRELVIGKNIVKWINGQKINWKGRDEEEGPGNDGEKKWKKDL
jgi:hypothetical protein